MKFEELQTDKLMRKIRSNLQRNITENPEVEESCLLYQTQSIVQKEGVSLILNHLN